MLYISNKKIQTVWNIFNYNQLTNTPCKFFDITVLWKVLMFSFTSVGN